MTKIHNKAHESILPFYNEILKENTINQLDDCLFKMEDFLQNNIFDKDKIAEYNSDKLNFHDTFYNIFKELELKLAFSEEEYHFVQDFIMNKCEYNTQEDICIGIAVENDLLDKLNLSNISDYYTSIKNITQISHVLKLYKSKGLNKKSYIYYNILMKINKIIHVYNFYAKTFETKMEAIENWSVGLSENVDTEVVETV